MENRSVVFRAGLGAWLRKGTGKDFGGDGRIEYFDGRQLHECIYVSNLLVCCINYASVKWI